MLGPMKFSLLLSCSYSLVLHSPESHVINKSRVSASSCVEREQNMAAISFESVSCPKMFILKVDLTKKTTEMSFSASKHSSMVNSFSLALW